MGDLLRAVGLGGRGRPGEARGSNVFCPLTHSWLARTTELELCGSRTLYDDHEVGAVMLEADDFNRAAAEAGWKLPAQLREAVVLCEYCEAYCLGRADGPRVVPPLAELDRNAVLRDLAANEAP